MNEPDFHPEEPAETAEFWRLAQAYCNGTHSPQERERLEAILWDNAQLRDQFLDYASVHAELCAQACFFDSPSIPPGMAAPPDLSRAGQHAQTMPNASPSGLANPASEAGPLPKTESIPAITSSSEDLLSGLLFPPATPSPLGGQAPDKFGGLLGAVSSLFHPPMVFLTLLTAILCSVLASYAFLRSETAAPQHQIAVQRPLEITPVAFLASANGCQWGGPSQDHWQVGKNVQLGDQLTLHEGIADFRLASGVTISIEGPAAVVMNSPTSLVVQYGKISAHVPWTVTDFKVLASTCRITATDAEFGVRLTGSEVEIHTFTGEVIVGSSPFEVLATDRLDGELDISKFRRHEKDLPSGSEFVEACVPKGRALRLMGAHSGMKILRWQRAKEHEFTTKLSMAGALYVSDDYVNAVKESKPVAYWRFETLSGDRIPSEVSPANDLCIVGKARIIMDGDGRVVEFGRPGCEGHLVSSEPLNDLAASDYSMEVWFKASHVHRGCLMGLAVNQHMEPDQVGPTNSHAFMLETVGALETTGLRRLGLNDSGRLRFLHRDPPGLSFKSGTSCFSAKPYTPRRWQHVVAVKKGSTMRLYLNGDLSATSEDPTSLARDLYLEVGQLVGNHKIVPFVGQMDELSVYNRALSEKEIKQHYKAMSSRDKKTKQKPAAEA